jgi:hypothetical protein
MGVAAACGSLGRIMGALWMTFAFVAFNPSVAVGHLPPPHAMMLQVASMRRFAAVLRPLRQLLHPQEVGGGGVSSPTLALIDALRSHWRD